MRAFWVLLRREVSSKWMMFATSLALGALVALVPYLTSEGTARQMETRSAAALAVALLWAVLLAVGLGGSCLARDLVEHRIAFDFRLPASAVVVSSTRLCGALLVVLIAGGLVIPLPAVLGIDLSAAAAGLDFLASDAGVRSATGPLGILAIVSRAPLLVGALLLVSNLLGLAALGRRAWFALDLASSVAVGVAVSVAVDRLRYWGADEVPVLVAFGAVAAIGLALAGAATAQVAVGRTEVGRAHRSFSLLYVPICVCVASGAGAYAAWYGSPRAGDLDLRFCQVAPVGEHLVSVIGHARGREGDSQFRFLLDPLRGRWRLTGPLAGLWPTAVEPRASEDGGTVAWLEWSTATGAPNPTDPIWQRSGAPPSDLVVETTLHVSPVGAALGAGGGRSLIWRRSPVAWSLSPDGTLVASRQIDSPGAGDRVLLEEVATGRLVRAIRIPGLCGPGRIDFADDHRIRVACGEDNPGNDLPSSSLLEIDTANAEVRPLGMSVWRGHPIDWQRQELRGHGRVVRSVRGETLGPSATLELADATSGARLALVRLPPGSREGFEPSNGRIFRHGGFGIFEYFLGRRFLALYDPLGRYLAGVEFRRGCQVALVAETADGRSALLAIDDNPDYLGRRSCDTRAVLLDTRTGDQRVLAENLEYPPSASVRSPTVVFRTCDGSLLWFDTTGARLLPLLRRVESGVATRSTGQSSRSLEGRGPQGRTSP